MKKNIIWLIILILLVSAVVYYKQFYPMSQWQLRNSVSSASAMPAEHYLNATDKNCGIWYRSDQTDRPLEAKNNDDVKNCFSQKYNSCESGKILIIDDKSVNDQEIIYSLIRIIKPNDQGECIIQNYYQEESADTEQVDPFYYLNTCTVLEENFVSSCEPQYIKDRREIVEPTEPVE
jgi:hypothetical protein